MDNQKVLIAVGVAAMTTAAVGYMAYRSHQQRNRKMKPICVLIEELLTANDKTATPLPDTLLNDYEELTKPNSEGYSAIHQAAIHGNLAAVEQLFSAMTRLQTAREQQIRVIDFTADRNRWTVLHIAAAQGDVAIVKAALAHGSDPNNKDVAGHTPLILASCNGHLEVVDLLLAHGASQKPQLTATGETALYFAARNDRKAIVQRLLAHSEAKDALFLDTINGATPLHAACAGACPEVVAALLEAGCEVDSLRRDAYTPLHAACIRGQLDIVRLMLDKGANPCLPTKFGTTCLHEAAFACQLEIVKLLLNNSNKPLLKLVDNDGETPLHRACNARKQALPVMEFLINSGADINAADNGDGTPLHLAACCHNHDEAAERCLLLLNHGADLTACNMHGWTPLHLARDLGKSEVCIALEQWARANNPQFLATFNPEQPRDLSGKPKRAPAPESLPRGLSLEARHAVLEGDCSLESIAKRLLTGKSKNVIVLTGAGISTSAGLFDFRGTETQKQRQAAGIPQPSAVFNLASFTADPQPFYSMVRDFFLPVVKGEIKPSAFHRLLALLHHKGWLQRVYTQNIDGLDVVAGVPEEKVIESHGTMHKATCTNTSCGAAVQDMKKYWAAVEAKEVPVCDKCGSVVRPDVVFFGMPLPLAFSQRRKEDFERCDLLIVAGTTLVVYPFASLVTEVSPQTPRVLFNSEPTGPWKTLNPQTNYRDVAVIGDCDAGALKLASLLGSPDL